jgi:hypothetical protein
VLRSARITSRVSSSLGKLIAAAVAVLTIEAGQTCLRDDRRCRRAELPIVARAGSRLHLARRAEIDDCRKGMGCLAETTH